jgi:hypothetical protein
MYFACISIVTKLVHACSPVQGSPKDSIIIIAVDQQRISSGLLSAHSVDNSLHCRNRGLTDGDILGVNMNLAGSGHILWNISCLRPDFVE